MNSSIPNELSETKIQFFSEEECLSRKQELESVAEGLREDFESHFVTANQSASDAHGNNHIVYKVDAAHVSDYLTKLGALVNDTSEHAWEIERPTVTAELRYLIIEGNLRLARSTLPSLSLDSVTIIGETDFTGARFLGYFLASRTDFSGEAYFNHSAFLIGMSFDHAQFTGHAYFSSAEVSGSAAFLGSQFKRDGYFIDTSFCGGSMFSKSIFGARALFRRASFSSNINAFDEAAFNDVADFEESKFCAVSFRRASFSSKAGFQNSVFAGKADFSGSTFTGMANFGSVVFADEASFLDCQFKKQTTFSGSSFALCPRFHEAVLHQDTSFSGGRFASMALTARVGQWLSSFRRRLRKLRPSVVGGGAGEQYGDVRIDWDAEARAYRTLKLHMSRYQAQHEATHFFAGEMRCRRREFDLKNSVHYLVSLLYDLLSEFGQSTGRVLFWMLLINAAFTYGYFIQAEQDAIAGHVRFAIVEQPHDGLTTTPGERWDRHYSWLALSMQSLNPVAFLSPKNTWVQLYDGGLFAQGVSQSLLNLVLLVLLAISLRGQFRRGSGGGD
jgi:uncharacterized protein YjbI with pentapeptide repeats